LIGQEFKSEKKIIIEESMLPLYKGVCSEFYKKKVVVKSTKIIKETKNLTQNRDPKSLEEAYAITEERLKKIKVIKNTEVNI